MQFKYIAVFLLFHNVIKISDANVPAPTTKGVERLPKNVKPVHYDLSLTPDLQTSKLDGKVIISLKIDQTTDTIVLNSANQEIKSIELKAPSAANAIPVTFSLSEDQQILNIKASVALPVGEAELTIVFSGSLRDDMLGCYRATENDAQGKFVRYHVLTFLDQRYARSCFPCWDEPAMKATFVLTLTVPNDLTTLSNTLVDKTNTIENGKKVVVFQKTPIMSTYLLAFAIGQYEFIASTTKTNLPVQIYTLIGKKDKATFALEVTTKAVAYFTDYVGVPLPLQKLDSIVIPFTGTTEMENFGLIMYHETTVLEDPKKPSEDTEITITQDICDVISHQWFGNIVTIEWWIYLGLQEAISNFLKHLCLDNIFPQYDELTSSYAFTFQEMLEADSYMDALPVQFTITELSEIDQLFDGKHQNCFKKGGSLLRMVYDFVGAETFRKGLNLFVNRHQGGIVVNDDVWTVMEEVSNKPFKKIMQTWLALSGLPVIIIESSTQNANNVRALVISQKRFLIDPNDKDDQSSWIIPMAFSTQSKPTEVAFWTTLERQKDTILIEKVNENEWVKLNPGIAVFYRVKYTDDMYKQLMLAIKNKSIPLMDRIKIADDAFAFAKSGLASITLFLDIISNMLEEEDWIAWNNLVHQFDQIYFLLIDFTSLDTFYTFGQELLKPITKKVGFDFPPNEKYIDKQKRYWALWSLFLFRETNYAQFALKKFQDYVNKVGTIPDDQRLLIYRCALIAGGRGVFESLQKLYHDPAVTDDEKFNTLCAFASVDDPKLADDMLQFSLSKEVNLYDAQNILQSVSYSQVGHEKAWEFFKTNYDYFLKLFSTDNQAFLKMIGVLIDSFTVAQKVEAIQKFLTEKKIDVNAEPIRNALRKIRINAAWLQRDGEVLKKYFAAGFKPPA